MNHVIKLERFLNVVLTAPMHTETLDNKITHVVPRVLRPEDIIHFFRH